MNDRFHGSFTDPEPLSQGAIDAAMQVLSHGRLHRYTVAPGEVSETALLEEDFAARTGARYCVAVASGGYAIGAALRACGVGQGNRVLTNAFTLAPVPGAIAAVGAMPVYVGVTRDLVIDLDDLSAKLDRADVLLLSHMRGHICDMTRLMALCDAAGVRVIEDCAHTMGAGWDGVPTGRWGVAGCFSTQTYKHVNSGEGGLLITDDADLAARAILLSGSYMLYDRHTASPPAEAFEELRYKVPNISGRMDNLRAAILRPQLRDLDLLATRWNALHDAMVEGLRETPGIYLPQRPARENYVASSIQFLLTDHGPEQIARIVARCADRGVSLKWFGGDPAGYTARYDHWRYAQAAPMPQTDATLACLLDMRLPLGFDAEDCALIARIIREEIAR